MGSAPASGAVAGALAGHFWDDGPGHYLVSGRGLEPAGEGAGWNARGGRAPQKSN